MIVDKAGLAYPVIQSTLTLKADGVGIFIVFTAINTHAVICFSALPFFIIRELFVSTR
jgi:hypothetical protein